MKKYLLSFWLVLSCYLGYSQITITGTVMNEANLPLENVNITVLQSLNGTKSNNKGFFILEIPKQLESVTLEFSYLGYKSTLHNINLSNTNDREKYQLDVTMIESILELEEVTISAGFAKEKDKLPYVISTLKKKDIATSGQSNLSQNLTKIPGVYNISFGNGVGKPVVRGLTNANLIVLNNGVKQESFQFSSSHPFLIDEMSAERFEIIKGPTSLQYGSDAVGGVVNVIKERPASINTIQGNFTSNYHTNTNGYLNSIGIKGSGKKIFWGVRASLKSHEDFSDGNEDDVFNTRFNENNFSVNLGTRTNIGKFSLTYSYTQPEYGIQNKASQNLIKNNPELLSSGRNNQVWYQNLTNHFIGSNNTIFLNKNILDIDLGYQSNLREANGGMFNPQQQALIIPTFASMQLNTFTYNIKMSMPFGDDKLIFGINGALISNDADEEKPNNPLLDSKINDFGIYAIGDIKLNEKITATSGLRYDFRNITSDPIATQTTNRFEVDNTYNSLTGSLGLVYNFKKDQFLKANISSGFRSPTIPELTQNGIHSGRYERGNENLKAQRNYQFDLNYHFHKPWMTIDVSPFFNKVDNYIYLIKSTENAPIGNGTIFQHIQNDANLYGGEIAVDIHPKLWLAFHSSLSLIRADLTDAPLNVEHPTFIPQDRWNNELKFQMESLAFLKQPFASVELINFFEQNRTGQNERTTPAYNLLNMRLGGQIKIFGQNTNIFINGFNLTNETYIDHLSITRRLDLNMIGRNIVVGLNVPFTIMSKQNKL